MQQSRKLNEIKIVRRLPAARRKILSCITSLMLIFCIILLEHIYITKCQTHFRPIKPPPYPSQGLLTSTTRLASFVQQQQQLPQFNQHRPRLPISGYQTQNIRPSLWSQNKINSFVAALPLPLQMNDPSGRSSLLPAQQGQQQMLLNNLNVANERMMSAAIMSDRRASSGQPVASHFVASGEANQYATRNTLQAQANNEQQVPTRPINAPVGITALHNNQHDNSQQQQQQQHKLQWQDHSGKLLICYYATKQTAPYWPKDSREFIVPANRLEQAASEFLKMNIGLTSRPSRSQRFSSPVGRHPHSSDFFTHDTNTNSLPLGSNHNQSDQMADQQQRQSTFTDAAGGRIVVVAPKFVPFNKSMEAVSSKSNMMNHNEIAVDRPESLAQMFFIANNRRKTIADRQDNGATITSTTSSTASTNQSNAKQLAPQLAGFSTTNNDQVSGDNNSGGGGGGRGIIVSEQNKSKHDLNSNRNIVGGPQSNFDEGRMTGGEIVSLRQAATTTISTPLLRLPVRNGNAQNSVAPPSQSTLSIDNERPPAVNNRDHLERAAQARQQSPLSPPMSRTFLGTSPSSSWSWPSSVAPMVPSHNSNTGKTIDQGPLFGQPSINSEHGNFYYYYNLPNSNNQSPHTTSTTAVVVDGGSSVTPTTISLAAGSSSYRPASLDQQQHHELSGTTLAGFNNNGNPQRGKSMHVRTDNDVPQPVSTSSAGSLLPSMTMLPAINSPTSYLINSPSQNQPLDRLIVSNGPSSLGPAPSVSPSPTTTSQRLVYSGPPSMDSPSPDLDDLLKLPSVSTPSDDEPMSGKTTPIVLPLPPNSSKSPSLAATNNPHGSPVAPALAGSGGVGLVSKAPDESLTSINRNNPHQQGTKQNVGVGGNSLSAALVSSPLSTMFDVFGAASQYLMRFKPSSLISPASFAAFNSIGSDQNSLNKPRTNSSSSSSSSIPSLVSLPFTSGHSQHVASSITNYRGSATNSSNGIAGGFLSRLSLRDNQRREDICGRTIQTPERRIIGGEGAKYGEFPYQVHIKIAKHQCGGALIDRQSIVTAAHCVYHFITRAPVSKLQIVIGAYDIEDEQYQELPPQYFKVNKVKLHPSFRFSASHPDRYDIAILKLDKPVKYTDNVLPVCLPGKDLKYENMVGTVTGFGKTDPSLSNRYGTRLLQKVDVPIIENSECERWHRTRGIDLKIFPEMMCAGYEDGLKDACVGDSGGPLVVKTPVGSGDSFRWTLAGITSAGFGCAQSRQPGIYHRVSHTVDWILENLD